MEHGGETGTFPLGPFRKKRWPGCEGGLYRGTTVHMNGVRGRVQQRKGLREKKRSIREKKSSERSALFQARLAFESVGLEHLGIERLHSS